MDYILALHDRFAESILTGRKTRELRRRIPNLAVGDRIFIYSTRPRGAMIGGFTIGGVTTGAPNALWRRFRSELSLSKDEFDAYTEGATRCSALEVTKAFRLKRPAPLAELKAVEPEFHVPQSAAALRSHALQLHLDALAGP